MTLTSGSGGVNYNTFTTGGMGSGMGYPEGEEEDNEEEEKPWYLDHDNDGYHSEIRISKDKPLGGNWISTTNGEDCDDTNSLVWNLNTCGECKKESECDGPCKNKDLRHKKVSNEVKELIDQRIQVVETLIPGGEIHNTNVKSFELQTIENGYGDLNLDRYDLNINQLPDGYTPQQLFEEIRINFADFINGGNIIGFGVELMPYSENDGTTWNSNNPIGAAMDFDNNMDTSTVICSDYSYEDMSWTFTTVRSADHLGHFVSGHRQFGLEQNADGSYSFYLRGVDRLGQWMDFVFNDFNPFGEDFLFNNAADTTWKNLMETLENYINELPGAEVTPFDISRDDYGKRYPFDPDDCQN